MEPLLSPEVKKWRSSKKNAAYFDGFDEIVSILNTNENRMFECKGDGYDRHSGACHQHFTKKLALFYDYVDTQLCLRRVKKHVNDNNHWRPV